MIPFECVAQTTVMKGTCNAPEVSYSELPKVLGPITVRIRSAEKTVLRPSEQWHPRQAANYDKIERRFDTDLLQPIKTLVKTSGA